MKTFVSRAARGLPFASTPSAGHASSRPAATRENALIRASSPASNALI
jgi:hypothetical protein